MNKTHLPTKVCAACGRPFSWRKKWRLVWDEVKYCSKRCQGHGRFLAKQRVRSNTGDTI